MEPSNKMIQDSSRTSEKVSSATDGDHGHSVIPAIAVHRAPKGDKKIGRFAKVPIEELVYCANRQRRVYGLEPARE